MARKKHLNLYQGGILGENITIGGRTWGCAVISLLLCRSDKQYFVVIHERMSPATLQVVELNKNNTPDDMFPHDWVHNSGIRTTVAMLPRIEAETMIRFFHWGCVAAPFSSSESDPGSDDDQVDFCCSLGTTLTLSHRARRSCRRATTPASRP